MTRAALDTRASDCADRCGYCLAPAVGLVVDSRGGQLACAAHGWERIRERDDAHWFAHLRAVEGSP